MKICRNGAALFASHALACVCAAGLALSAFPLVAPAAPTAKLAPEPVFGKPGWQDDYIARSIVRAGLMDLRLRPTATSDDYRILAHVLGIAQTLTPNDPDIVRRLVEAAHNAQDDAMLETATRRLVQLDPTDTVAQLRLISSRISRLQTIEDRLKAYANFMGAGGDSLDGSIRSRLALDAALLCRELGDDSGFSDYLKAALRFDSTNKEAALVALSHYKERVNEPTGRVQMLSNLLLADPLDPNVHRQLAMEMASGGSYVQARRFHDMSDALFTIGGVRTEEHFAVEGWVFYWATDGANGVLEAFRNLLATEKYKAQQAEERAKKDLRETDAKANEIRLAPAIERVRLLAADTAQNGLVLEECRQTLEVGAKVLSTALEEIEKAKDKVTPEAAAEYRRASAIGLSEIQILRLWTNVDLEKVAADLVKTREILGDQPPLATLAAADAWVLLRAGKNEEALAAFDALADVEFESLTDRGIAELEPAKIGKALALEALMRPSEAAAIYKEVALSRAADASGMWCKLRMEKMGAADPERDALSKRLTAIGESVPRLVEDMVKDPTNTMSLSADVPLTLAHPTDRNDLMIKLRNKTKIPLGLGTDRAINSRFLAQPSIDVHTKAMTAVAQPEILDIDRRMRLMPGETIEVRVRVDAGYTGWLMESGAANIVRSRFRIMQGFYPGQNGAMREGPGCLTADSPQVVRNPLKETRSTAPQLVDAIRLASGDDAISLLLALRARTLFDETIGSSERLALAQAIAAHYPSFDVKLRMLALVVVPNAAMFEEFKIFDDVAKNEAAPGATALAIITRITDAADPALTAALASTNPVTKEVARLHHARLEDATAMTLSRRGFKLATDVAAGSPAPAPTTTNTTDAPNTPVPATEPAKPKVPTK